MIRLSIAERSGQPKLFTFPKDDITIGRAQGNDVILPRNNISKRHTRVFRRQGKLVVRDLDSTNGTFLNGRRIHDDEVLHAGDRIFLADFVLIIEEDENAATPVPPELKSAAPPPLPADDLESVSEAEAEPLDEPEGRPTIAAEEPPELQLSAADLHTAPPDMVLSDLARAAARRSALEPEPDLPPGPPMPIRQPPVAVEAPVPSRPSRGAPAPAAEPGPARRVPEAAPPAAEPTPARSRGGRAPAPSEHRPQPLPIPEPLEDAGLDEATPPPRERVAPAAGRGRPRAAASESAPPPEPRRESRPDLRHEPRHEARPTAGRGAAQPSRATGRPASGARPTSAAGPAAPKAPAGTLGEDQVQERLLTRANDIAPIKDAEPAVFGDHELQGRIKSALLDELAILEAEDLLDPRLDRDELVEELSKALFALGPFPRLAADDGLESFVAYPDGTCFERRAGHWARATTRIPTPLVALLARRLVAGMPGCTPSGAAETFRGRHPELAGVEVGGALGGSSLGGPVVRLDRTPTVEDDLERLADTGMLSMPMATFLRLCLEARQTLAVAGPQRAQRTALLRALVASLPAEQRVVWVADPAGAGPPASAALVVRLQPPSVGESLLAESDDAGGGLGDLVQCLQPDLLVVERTDAVRDVPLVRAVRARLGSVVLGVEADRWEPPVPGEPGKADAPTRPAAPGVDPRLAACVDVVAELVPIVDGSVRMLRIAERAADGGDPFVANTIFEFVLGGPGELGEYKATRTLPRFLERRKARGKRIDASLFQG
ncbi:MAG: FHA domain-containing protein [Deltaproteobacteria bacterium]|nr:FHA domain-containing protein [Deltaproteobacteria bacterium]